jgi:CRP-like cAMP-binding protein
VVSLYYVTRNGNAAASAGVGNEGMVGVPLFMGGHSMPSSAVVQTAGQAWRLERRRLNAAFEGTGLMQGLLLRYALSLICQVSQTAACNRHHSVEQQLSRWLLSTLDRAPAGELVMTQELVASMLGVRRETVTEAAGKLQDGGYIRYRRGHITVIDRIGLTSRACECYGVVKNEQHRLLSDHRYRQAGLAQP